MSVKDKKNWEYFWGAVGKTLACICVIILLTYLLLTSNSWAPHTIPMSFERIVEGVLVIAAGLMWIFALGGVFAFSNEALVEFRALTGSRHKPKGELSLRKIRQGLFHGIWVSFVLGIWLDDAKMIWVMGGALFLWLFLLHIDHD